MSTLWGATFLLVFFGYDFFLLKKCLTVMHSCYCCAIQMNLSYLWVISYMYLGDIGRMVDDNRYRCVTVFVAYPTNWWPAITSFNDRGQSVRGKTLFLVWELQLFNKLNYLLVLSLYINEYLIRRTYILEFRSLIN